MINPLHPNPKHNEIATIGRVRLMLCEHTALALCVLVAADVLDTVIKPVHAYLLADVVKMGFVTILRTGIAYFLARELKELEEDHSTEKGSSSRGIRRTASDHGRLHRSTSYGSGVDSSGTDVYGPTRGSSNASEDDLTADVNKVRYRGETKKDS